jgi:hypothetical protein
MENTLTDTQETSTGQTKPTSQFLNKKVWTALILLGLAGQICWAVENQFYNTFMYNEITPDPRPIS